MSVIFNTNTVRNNTSLTQLSHILHSANGNTVNYLANIFNRTNVITVTWF